MSCCFGNIVDVFLGYLSIFIEKHVDVAHQNLPNAYNNERTATNRTAERLPRVATEQFIEGESDTESNDDEVRVNKKLKSDTLAAAELLSIWDKSGSHQPMSKPNSPEPNGTISGPGRVERRARSMDHALYSSSLNSKCVESMHKSQTEQFGAVTYQINYQEPQGATVSGPACAKQAEAYPPSFVTPRYRPTMLSEEIRPIITVHHTPQSVTRTLPMSTSELA